MWAACVRERGRTWMAAGSLLVALVVNGAALLGSALLQWCWQLLNLASARQHPVSDDRCTFYEGQVCAPPHHTRPPHPHPPFVSLRCGHCQSNLGFLS